MKVSNNDYQGTLELTQSNSIDADTAKTPWYTPKLRALQVSQETKRGGGG